jgi:hypothetical protein
LEFIIWISFPLNIGKPIVFRGKLARPVSGEADDMSITQMAVLPGKVDNGFTP